MRRSPRARRWRLEAPWGEPPRLTAPRSMRQAEVDEVLRNQRAWIEEQRLQQVPRLRLNRLAVSESAARVGARQLVSALAEEEAERLGVVYRRIRIGGQRTLWGSCSPSGTLSFNWRLVLAPARGARLRGRARALPPARSQPLAALLGARRGAPPALARAARLAARARARTACLQSVRVTARPSPTGAPAPQAARGWAPSQASRSPAIVARTRASADSGCTFEEQGVDEGLRYVSA